MVIVKILYLFPLFHCLSALIFSVSPQSGLAEEVLALPSQSPAPLGYGSNAGTLPSKDLASHQLMPVGSQTLSATDSFVRLQTERSSSALPESSAQFSALHHVPASVEQWHAKHAALRAREAYRMKSASSNSPSSGTATSLPQIRRLLHSLPSPGGMQATSIDQLSGERPSVSGQESHPGIYKSQQHGSSIASATLGASVIPSSSEVSALPRQTEGQQSDESQPYGPPVQPSKETVPLKPYPVAVNSFGMVHPSSGVASSSTVFNMGVSSYFISEVCIFGL